MTTSVIHTMARPHVNPVDVTTHMLADDSEEPAVMQEPTKSQVVV